MNRTPTSPVISSVSVGECTPEAADAALVNLSPAQRAVVENDLTFIATRAAYALRGVPPFFSTRFPMFFDLHEDGGVSVRLGRRHRVEISFDDLDAVTMLGGCFAHCDDLVNMADRPELFVECSDVRKVIGLSAIISSVVRGDSFARKILETALDSPYFEGAIRSRWTSDEDSKNVAGRFAFWRDALGHGGSDAAGKLNATLLALLGRIPTLDEERTVALEARIRRPFEELIEQLTESLRISSDSCSIEHQLMLSTSLMSVVHALASALLGSSRDATMARLVDFMNTILNDENYQRRLSTFVETARDMMRTLKLARTNDDYSAFGVSKV